MSTELATKEQPSIAEIGMGERGILLTSLEDAWKFAAYIVNSKLAPSHFDTQSKVLIAMQLGKEAGLSPMMALRTIAVINGTPSFWGQALPALAHNSGKLAPDGIQEWFERDGRRLPPKEEAGPIGEDWVAVCKTVRKGQTEGVERRFSVSDAQTAGLWSKKGPWQDYPKDMLRYKARARSFKHNLADVLMGMDVVEDIQDVEPRTVSTVTAAPPPEHDPLGDKIFANDAEPTPEPDPEPEPVKPPDRGALIEQIDTAITSCSRLTTWRKLIAAKVLGDGWHELSVDELQSGLAVVTELAGLIKSNKRPKNQDELEALIDDAKDLSQAAKE